jgi:hypothetical protein
MTVLSHVVDLVGFRSCAHFFVVEVLSPDPPTRFTFVRTYHVACSFVRFSHSLPVGCSLESVFLLVVRVAFDTEDPLPML